jgi:hypothetical protein
MNSARYGVHQLLVDKQLQPELADALAGDQNWKLEQKTNMAKYGKSLISYPMFR